MGQMAKVSLVGYFIKIRKLRTKDYLDLYRFDESNDLFDVFKDYFSTHGAKVSNSQYAVEDIPNTDKKTILIERPRDAGPRMLEGVIRIGDYGYKTPIVNRQSKQLSYMRKNEDTELTPLYFLLYVPQKGDIPSDDKGIAIFQKFRKNGLKTAFLAHFSSYFEHRFPDYKVEMLPIAPEDIIDALNNGVIKEVKLTSYSSPDDVAEYYSTNDENKGKIVLTFEKGSFQPKFVDKLKKIFSHDLPIKKLIEFEWVPQDEIKVVVQINGMEKTFTMKEEEGEEEITPGIDISDSVTNGPDGFPTEQSLHDEAVKYLEFLKSYFK